MNRREEIEALLAEVVPRLEALHDAAMSEIAEAQTEADERIRRHDEAARELASTEVETARLSARREALPTEITRADLDEEYAREDELRGEYRDLGPRLGELEARRASLRGEMRRLNPRGMGHPSDATMHNLGRAAGVAHSARADLEHLRKELTSALDRAVNPGIRQHENLRATVEQLGRDRDWAMR